MSKQKKNNHLGQGFMTGLVLGVIGGLMNAKRPGYQTRSLLKEKIDVATEDVHDVRFKVDNLSPAVQHLSNEGSHSLNTATEAIEETIKHFKEETSPRLRRVQDKTDTLQAHIEEETIALQQLSPSQNEEIDA